MSAKLIEKSRPSKYIIYEYCRGLFQDSKYMRYELRNDNELKEFLFKHQDNLKNIEIFNKTDKCQINIDISINKEKSRYA